MPDTANKFTEHDKLIAKLSEYDFIVVIDKSGSMGEEDCPGDKSRWEYMQETAVAFCRDLEKIDDDGLGLVLFSGASIVKEDGVTTSRIKEIFAENRPSGSTPLDGALQAALSLIKTSGKKAFIVVFTDGVPDDRAAAAKVIIRASHQIEKVEDLTFLFVQVGREATAGRYLASLDDDLTTAKFDIVNAQTIEEAEKFPSTAELVFHAMYN